MHRPFGVGRLGNRCKLRLGLLTTPRRFQSERISQISTNHPAGTCYQVFCKVIGCLKLALIFVRLTQQAVELLPTYSSLEAVIAFV